MEVDVVVVVAVKTTVTALKEVVAANPPSKKPEVLNKNLPVF